MIAGVDVSKWQATTPSLAGLSFLFARASVGSLSDERYAMHIANARRAGLLVGAYHFAYSLSIAAQAANFLRCAGDVDFLAIDVEGPSAPTHAETAAFIKLVQAAGRKCGLYHSDSGYFEAGQDFDWVAKWSTTAPSRHWDFWQYRGSPLDLDRFDGTLAQLQALAQGSTAVNSYPVPKVPSIGTVARGKILYTSDAMVATDPNRVIVDPTRDMPYLGSPATAYRVVEYVDDHGVHSGKSYFIHTGDLTNIRAVAAPVTDCAPAVATATASLNATIGDLRVRLADARTAERERIALAVGAAEAARIRGI